jgi:hypothetical protein
VSVEETSMSPARVTEMTAEFEVPLGYFSLPAMNASNPGELRKHFDGSTDINRDSKLAS